MYKYNFTCFSVTFPYKLALYLDHSHPQFCLPFSSSLTPFPFLSISSLIFQAITLGIFIYEKNIHLCFYLVCLLPHAVLQLQPFPPNEGSICLQPPDAVCTHGTPPSRGDPATPLWNLDIYMNPVCLFIIWLQHLCRQGPCCLLLRHCVLHA